MKVAALLMLTLTTVLLSALPAMTADKVVVIPLNTGGSECAGTLSGTRWCDNGDGTVTDMTTGLVWLKDAGCLGMLPWLETTTWNDAQAATGLVESGDCNLSDGSTEGDWRLPTTNELLGLANGAEQVRYTAPRVFSGVLSEHYCTSSTTFYYYGAVWVVSLSNGEKNSIIKTNTCNAWPVRGGR